MRSKPGLAVLLVIVAGLGIMSSAQAAPDVSTSSSDAGAPSVTFTSVPPVVSRTGAVRFEYTTSQPASAYCTITGTSFFTRRDNCPSPQSFFLDDGEYTFELHISNQNGYSTSSYSFRVERDPIAPGRYRFSTVADYPSAGTPLAGDFNEDGKQDLLLFGEPSYVRLGKGDGTFGPLSAPIDIADQASESTEPSLVDMNGDGHLDLVTASPFAVVQLGRGDGTFRPPSTGADGGALADFNGDGRLDIARGLGSANYGLTAVGVRLGNYDGTFDGEIEIPVSGAAFDTCDPEDFGECRFAAAGAGDIDGDGDPDLVLTRSNDIAAFAPITLINNNFTDFETVNGSSSAVQGSNATVSMPT